jgi:DNA invertase Pin-like site-specific DNA recombinase
MTIDGRRYRRNGSSVKVKGLLRILSDARVPTGDRTGKKNVTDWRTLVSLRDGIDLLTPAGRLIANVLASVSQYETEVRGERIRAGIDAKHARGETWGNGRPKGSAHKATPEVCEQVKRMVADGTKKAVIARVCKVSRQTVYTILGAREA